MSQNGSMKKHEACYWLNQLIDQQRATIRYALTEKEATTVKYGDREGQPLTEEQIQYNQESCQERIDEAEKKIVALDIAACALTNK